eukprot:73161-Prymnesium_polylepis.1
MSKTMTPLGMLRAPGGGNSVNRFWHEEDESGQRKRKATPDVKRQPEMRKTDIVIDVDTGKYAGAKLVRLEVRRRHFEPAHARSPNPCSVRWAISAGRLPTSRRRSL